MIIAFLRFTPIPRKRDAVLEILSSVANLTRIRAGCIDCGLYEGHDDERAILYLEQWQSSEHMYAHIRSDLYFRVIAAMELAAKTPELRFHEVSEAMGMELIRHLRDGEKEK